MTGCDHLAVTGGETGATTDDHPLDPGRLKPEGDLKPREHQDPPTWPDAVEALLRQFRPAIVRCCRARLARNRARLARALLAHLPAAQRRLLLLRVVAGLSAEDTGTCSTCHPARSGWPSTGPWSGSGSWPPMRTERAS